MKIDIETVRPGHLKTVHRLNEAAVPHVNSLPLGTLDRFRVLAAAFRVATGAGEPLGVLVAFRPGADYGSDNYRWFSGAYDDFVYIDRVMVDEAARGRGIARRLYADIEALARGWQAPRLVCEVNIRPANDASHRFHDRLGFREVGRQETEGGRKLVSLLTKPLD